MNYINVAVWQTASFPADIKSNISALTSYAKKARLLGADLLIAPEMQLTGYSTGSDLKELSIKKPLDMVSEVCMKENIAIITGGPELAEGNLYNSAVFVDNKGLILDVYRKVQLFGEFDDKNFTPGIVEPRIVEYMGINIGILICYDVEFPERVRSLAKLGADLVAVPTAQMTPFEFVADKMIATRAFENRIFVAYANMHGSDENFSYVGRSSIVDPFGRILAVADRSGEMLIIAKIEKKVICEARICNDYLKDLNK